MEVNISRVEDELVQKAVKIGELFTTQPVNVHELKIAIASMRLALDDIERLVLADEVVNSLPAGFNSGRKK